MKTLATMIGLTFASNTFASCYSLTGYDMLNCMENERQEKQHQQAIEQAIRYKPTATYQDNRQPVCTKQVINTGNGYYVKNVCN
jgi:hypothetical protein